MIQTFTVPEQQVFRDSIDVYGVDCQLDQVQEEAMELALAIRKYKRAKEAIAYTKPDDLKNRREELISEIADVIIMTQQCRIMFPDDEIQREISRKLERQAKRIYEKTADARMKRTTTPYLFPRSQKFV